MIVTVPPTADRPALVGATSYILHERARRFQAEGVGWLSIKSFFGGEASYGVGRGRYAVDDRAYLVLNQDQPYSVAIDDERPVESFCIFFAPGFAEAALRDLTTPDDRLLLDPTGATAAPLCFFERTYPHDDLVTPALRSLHRAVAGAAEPGWLSEQLLVLMGQLLHVNHDAFREAERLPAARPATREELYRRLHRARDYAAALCHTQVTLDDMAQAACLSPNHLLRTFRQAFGQTPYQYVVTRRLDRAREMLANTDRSVTEIALAVGFESLGAFSWAFRRRTGLSPTEFRRQTR